MEVTIPRRFALLVPLVLIACGGGGGGGGGDGGSYQTSYSLTIPTKLNVIPLLGSASYPATVSDYGVGTVNFPLSSALGGYGYPDAIYNAAASVPFQLYPVTHITSEVTSAWASGWTGQGVTISVIDDFNSVYGTIVKDIPTMTRTGIYEVSTFDYGKVQGTYDIAYSLNNRWTHGSLVANIAGGGYDGQQLAYSSVIATVKAVSKTSCTTLRSGSSSYTISCEPNYYISGSGSLNYQKLFNLTYKKVAGIAKQSNVVTNNVDLSSSQNPIKTIADIQGHLLNSASLGVINLSLGLLIPTSGRTFAQVMAEVEKTTLPTIGAVIIVAAGNGGTACASEDLNGCNAVAVAMAFQSATKDNTIVVGATSGNGASETIATYSTRAGILAQRFVLASGEEGDANMAGTSFAAPRVAGIAATLKQKYPSLTSAQIANIILLSASKDINSDGLDDFAGVSPIYGHGKASLTRALSLAGSI